MCAIGDQCELVSTSKSIVYWCKSCACYSLVHGSASVVFSSGELVSFQRLLQSLRPEDFNRQTPDGLKVLLKNQSSSVGLLLLPEEVNAIIKLLGNALLVREAMALMTPDIPKNN